MITPTEIRAKADRLYWKYVRAFLADETQDFFPAKLRANLKLKRGDLPATIAAVEKLRSHAKETRGSGYTIQWQDIRSRDWGQNRFPVGVAIDAVEDLLSLTGRGREFSRIAHVSRAVRDAFPQLDSWLVQQMRQLAALEDAVEGLIAVARYFVSHPWPDCYARQLPVPVDTKFIERHEKTLRQWLDLLLPPHAIRADETRFAYRFGLRDGQPHRAVRVLDATLQEELDLPFDEFSLPLRLLAKLPVRKATVIIVENQLNLLTVPPLPRGLAIRGEGKAVTRLQRLSWLEKNRIIYWGDIDVEGFEILSALRGLFPTTTSVLMDAETLANHRAQAVSGNATTPRVPHNLTPGELAAFGQCAEHNLRLEQERIPQADVDRVLAAYAKYSG